CFRFFFFSSRRRHTRSKRDWSSDVCSSDLTPTARCSDVHLAVGVPPMLRMHGDLLPIKFRELRAGELEGYITEILTHAQNQHFRSEERRVGKECRARWSPYDIEKDETEVTA